MIQAQIFIDKDELKGTTSLDHYLMQLLIKNGISGATSFVGFSGFGKHLRLKQPNQQFSFDDLPMLITFVDDAKKVKEVLTEIRKHYRGGFIITHEVELW